MARGGEANVQRNERLDQNRPLAGIRLEKESVAAAVRTEKEMVGQVLLDSVGGVGGRDLIKRIEAKICFADKAFPWTQLSNQFEVRSRQFVVDARQRRKSGGARSPFRRDGSNARKEVLVQSAR